MLCSHLREHQFLHSKIGKLTENRAEVSACAKGHSPRQTDFREAKGSSVFAPDNRSSSERLVLLTGELVIR